ncbi:CUN084 hypothetical protein [Culex nigripalpus nucleopolyhedrovirus]|uniref:Uncharacterized protein n=1 Tax=Culex nigripalpus nucleopolyhedrovirus (isolate Florida/1997) TaxID=645993 RepID=Q919J3_NPVCO|nr:CUN084 hypothetical protein [Culex nigripalpus nucleopolyhedrovirus]AAK94162.1 CUN084 hypothetical protein [Culex nigripalpus nucleopolyhedrovirus]
MVSVSKLGSLGNKLRRVSRSAQPTNSSDLARIMVSNEVILSHTRTPTWLLYAKRSGLLRTPSHKILQRFRSTVSTKNGIPLAKSPTKCWPGSTKSPSCVSKSAMVEWCLVGGKVVELIFNHLEFL